MNKTDLKSVLFYVIILSVIQMDIKNIEEQKRKFMDYTGKYIEGSDEEKIGGYKDKQAHSLFVMDEALLVDALFTGYNQSFLNLLALESLFHDVGRFEQLKMTGSFKDDELSKMHPQYVDHGDLGADIIRDHGLLGELIPDVRLYDEEIREVIRLHSKVNPELLKGIMRDYITSFKNYDLRELFLSSKAEKERDALTKVNTSIIQDVDRLDIFRKIVKGIWVPMATDDKIDPELFELFKQGKLPTMAEIKAAGKWNPNIGHLVRMSFINQMNLVPVLMSIKNEDLLDKVYEASGNEIVLPAYEVAKDLLDKRIENSEDGILVKK